MNTIAVVYTSLGGLIQTMKTELAEALPGYQIMNIADDSLIKEVIAAGKVTEPVKTRMMHYFRAAQSCDPDLIISACSSVGEVAEEADAAMPVQILRIDHAMIEKALTKGSRIGVLASLSTTIKPTVSYIQRLAAARGKNIQVTGKVAEGAYEANSRGEKGEHERLILEAAKELMGQVDVLILAQGSMAIMEKKLCEITGLPVYSSPKLCAMEAREICSRKERLSV